MSNPGMVAEMNRLVAGLLLCEGGVCLPSVGSLRVERCPAKRLSKHSVRPPHRVIMFSSQPAGLSLVEAVARAIRVADGDVQQAEAIYNRWLGYVLQENGVILEGVGVLAHKHFTPDPDFDKRLNPQGHEPVKLQSARRSDWVVWIGALAILVALGFGGYEYLMTIPDPAAGPAVVESRIEVPAPVTPEPAAPAAEEAFTKEATQPAEPQTVQQSVPQPVAAQPAQSGEMTAGRRYVVFGVFSSSENAVRAAEKAAADYAGIRCNVYRFGAKWMVSCFESDDAAACADFIRENRERMPDVWTYIAK